MAIAGPRGAGKTTLLEILAGMIPQNRVSGSVLVNERPVNAQQFRRLSGYVAQVMKFYSHFSPSKKLSWTVPVSGCMVDSTWLKQE